MQNGVPVLGRPSELPKTQELLLPLLSMTEKLVNLSQMTNVLLEADVRLQLGQTEEDISRTMGLTFPVVSVEDYEAALEARTAAEALAEADRAALEEATAPLDEAIQAGD